MIIKDQIDELRGYADLSRDEVAEVIYYMLTIYNGYISYVSDDFNAAIEKELLAHLKNFQENFDLIEIAVEEKIHVLREKNGN